MTIENTRYAIYVFFAWINNIVTEWHVTVRRVYFGYFLVHIYRGSRLGLLIADSDTILKPSVRHLRCIKIGIRLNWTFDNPIHVPSVFIKFRKHHVYRLYAQTFITECIIYTTITSFFAGRKSTVSFTYYKIIWNL